MKNKLLNIYCARYSKDKKKINLTLVCGEGQERQYYNTCINISSEGKINANVYGDLVCINIPLSKYNDYKKVNDKEQVNEEIQICEAMQDDLPF